jgi:DNA-directed RNA polymerase subunit H (RpoH/RPB5)
MSQTEREDVSFLKNSTSSDYLKIICFFPSLPSRKMNSVEVDLCECWLNTLQMCKDRGFVFPPAYDSVSTRDILLLRDNNRLDWIAVHKDDPQRHIYVKFVAHTKVTPNNIRASFPYIQSYFESKSLDVSRVDIVFVIQYPPAKLEDLEKEYDLGGTLHIYSFTHMKINPTRHIYTPHHIPISSEEVAALQRIYHLQSLSQLQLILTNDRIVRWYNFAPDTVLKIVPKQGVQDYRYRLVRKV